MPHVLVSKAFGVNKGVCDRWLGKASLHSDIWAETSCAKNPGTVSQAGWKSKHGGSEEATSWVCGRDRKKPGVARG